MKLKAWRKEKGISGEKFAEMIGSTQPTISRIEAGSMWPDRETLEKIVQATEGAVTANDFLGCEIPNPSEAAA